VEHAASRADGRRILITTSLVHLTNDACFSILYPLLPLVAADLGLSYAQVGLLKAALTGAQSAFQVPAGIAGERWGEALILLLGNAWVGLGLMALTLAGTYAVLVGLALVAGFGGNAQHPLGSAIVSRAFPPGRAATALGTLNFAGDLGKFLGPLLVGVLATQYGWRAALLGVGIPTLLLSLVLLAFRRECLPVPPPLPVRERAAGDGAEEGAGFRLLLLVGGLDSATRTAALTFLPFLLIDQGMQPATLSLLFSVIYGAGAAGKFACGWLGDRWGLVAVIVVTELATAVVLLAFLGATPWMAFPLALAFGFVLNGTSSAFLAGVANLVVPERRSRAYGTFFTASLGSSAIAPLAYGLLADRAGLTPTFVLMAIMTALIPLLVVPLRGDLTP
jgi:FSR family fosmidomycin resistance protein-like MFS transporter